MRTSIPIVIAVSWAVGASAAADNKPAARPAPPSYQISAIRAFAYLHDTGKLDGEDITVEDPGMDRPTGGDTGGDASIMTMIQVEVVVPDPKNPEGTVEVVVLADNKKKLTQKFDLLGMRSESSPRRVLPVLVYNTGCEPLTINAKLIVTEKKVKKTVSKSASVDFKCGE